MEVKNILRFNWVMLGVYGALALFFLCTGDQDRALMFLVGSLLWVAGIFIWQKNVNDGT